MPLGTTTTLNKEELNCCFLNAYREKQVNLCLTMTSRYLHEIAEMVYWRNLLNFPVQVSKRGWGGRGGWSGLVKKLNVTPKEKRKKRTTYVQLDQPCW